MGQCGVQVDPERVKVINEMSPPENISKLRVFLGMVNHCNLHELTQPLRELVDQERSCLGMGLSTTGSLHSCEGRTL